VRRALWRAALLYRMSYSAKAEYPVRCGLSIHHRRLWNTGSPAFADDDSWECGATSFDDRSFRFDFQTAERL